MDFSDLKILHEKLNDLFLEHQFALLDGDLPVAETRLDHFESELRKHIAIEEELLMPFYQRAGRIPGGPVEFYTGEHARLLLLLDQCRKILREAVDRSDSTTLRQRDIIRLFDQEAAFKSLTDHHHRREETLFFPTLNRMTTDEEKQRLLADCLEKGE